MQKKSNWGVIFFKRGRRTTQKFNERIHDDGDDVNDDKLFLENGWPMKGV